MSKMHLDSATEELRVPNHLSMSSSNNIVRYKNLRSKNLFFYMILSSSFIIVNMIITKDIYNY
jgi:hypothetical protein